MTYLKKYLEEIIVIENNGHSFKGVLWFLENDLKDTKALLLGHLG